MKQPSIMTINSERIRTTIIVIILNFNVYSHLLHGLIGAQQKGRHMNCMYVHIRQCYMQF